MNKFKNLIWIIGLIIVVLAIGYLGFAFYKANTMEVINPIVTMEVEGFGTMKFELYPEEAPESVKNFIALANNGYYDGLTFHRVIADFMVQGGDINGDGSGSATVGDLQNTDSEEVYSIAGEFVSNGVNNSIKFEKGVLAMARNDYTSISSDLISESYDSANAQFFIMLEDEDSLNGSYTSFGKIIEGIEVLEQIGQIEVTYSQSDVDEETGEVSEDAEISTPVEAPVITKVTVDTNGVDYGYPELLETFDYMTWLYAQYGLDSSTIITE